jgi:anti-sigma regulatory factor (Ser/Thr protein kinase)
VDPARSNLTVELSPSREAPGQARRTIGRWIAGRIPEQTRMDLMLCTSELVTNAIEHAPGQAIRVELSEVGTTVRVCVYDHGPAFSWNPAGPRFGSEHGRGLGIVRRLSERCGLRRNGQSNCVWFELDLREPSAN